MKESENLNPLQKFIDSLVYRDFDSKNAPDSTDQSQILDYFIQILKYSSLQGRKELDVHLHPEFFLLPGVEEFFSCLFTSLDPCLFPKVTEVVEHCYIFSMKCHCHKTISAIHRLIEKLTEQFPHLKEMHNNAIATILKEFFQPTIGCFLNHRKIAIDHLKNEFPLLYELFVAPLSTTPFLEHKLFNFYCNPWIFNPIIQYLECLQSSQKIFLEYFRRPLKYMEDCLQIIRSQTNDESWKELTLKVYTICKSSKKLEDFANQSFGILGEIKAASQLIKCFCVSEDILVFFPENQKEGKNCDLMVIRHETSDRELIEVKTKSPRHGLDINTAGNTQIWDDFFTNFSCAVCSYLRYIQEIVGPIFGLTLTKCFPLFSAYEGSRYGSPLPLINILTDFVTLDIPLVKWTSKEKLTHLLHALFLRPLVLENACVPLASEDVRLRQRQQTTKEALQKQWVNSLLNEAIEQLLDTYQHQKAEGNKIAKMYVALDLALSYRLLQDPLSNQDGNIEEIVEQSLLEAFQPFKNIFSSQSFDLDLLIIKP